MPPELLPIAMPVATEKMTRPRMLVLWFHVSPILQVSTMSGWIMAPVLGSSTAAWPGSITTVLYCCMVACQQHSLISIHEFQ